MIFNWRSCLASKVGDTMAGAIGVGGADRLILQHLLVGAGERVNVEGARAVANLTAKRGGVGQTRGEAENQKRDPAFHEIFPRGMLSGCRPKIVNALFNRSV